MFEHSEEFSVSVPASRAVYYALISFRVVQHSVSPAPPIQWEVCVRGPERVRTPAVCGEASFRPCARNRPPKPPQNHPIATHFQINILNIKKHEPWDACGGPPFAIIYSTKCVTHPFFVKKGCVAVPFFGVFLKEVCCSNMVIGNMGWLRGGHFFRQKTRGPPHTLFEPKKGSSKGALRCHYDIIS